MLDTKHDAGMPRTLGVQDMLEFLSQVFSETVSDAMGGTPRSEGLETSELDLVSQVLVDTKAGDQKGLVVVGMHNGPMNIFGGKRHPFLRSTLHRDLDPKLMKDFLCRLAGLGHFDPAPAIAGKPNPQLPWLKDASEQGWTFSETLYFKKGGNRFLLDYGIAHGNALPFMKLCAGPV